MERKIILDFIGQNFSNLSSIGLKQLTVFVYGKNYSDETLGSKLLNGDQLFAYDVKLPRIFCKKFPLEKMMSGMLELASDLNKLTIFKKSDFNFSLEEVYSGKNIQDLNFDYLYLYPVIKDDLRIGAILIYGTILNENFDLLSNSINLSSIPVIIPLYDTFKAVPCTCVTNSTSLFKYFSNIFFSYILNI